jgi:hypothetical protein
MKKKNKERENKIQKNSQGNSSLANFEELQAQDECNDQWVSAWKKTTKKKQ